MTHKTMKLVATLLFAALFSPEFVLAQEAGDISAPNIEATDTNTVAQPPLPQENDTATGVTDFADVSDSQNHGAETAAIGAQGGSARITTEYFGMQKPDARRGLAVGSSSAPARRTPVKETAASAAGDSAIAPNDSAIAVPVMTDAQPADSAEAAPAPVRVRTPVKIIATLTATAAVGGLITLFVVRSRDEDGEDAKKIPDPPDPPGF